MHSIRAWLPSTLCAERTRGGGEGGECVHTLGASEKGNEKKLACVEGFESGVGFSVGNFKEYGRLGKGST